MVAINGSGGDDFVRGTVDVVISNNSTGDGAGNGKSRGVRDQSPRFKESAEKTVASQTNGICFLPKAIYLGSR